MSCSSKAMLQNTAGGVETAHRVFG